MSFLTGALRSMGAAQANLENARAMAVAPLLHRVAPENECFARESRQIALRHAVFREVIRKLSELLGDEIPYIILKGEPLALSLYGDASFRSSTDIDLLVLPGDYEVVRKRLHSLGFVPMAENGPKKWAYNQEALHHPGYGVVVEIHWELAFPALPHIPPRLIFETRQSYELGHNIRTYVLADDWLGVHLALHFQQHMGFAKGLLDIAAWCDVIAPGLCRFDFLQRVSKLRLTGIVQWPLHTLAILSDEKPRMYASDVDLPVKTWAMISAHVLRGCLSRSFTGGVRDSLASLNHTIGPEYVVPLKALTMAVVDGSAGEKFRAMCRPIFEGPHFVGRAVRRWGLSR